MKINPPYALRVWLRMMLAGLALTGAAHADTIYVECSDSIQSAIVAASDGDEIVVAPCTYYEVLDLLGKAIWVHSSDGAEVTVVDGTGFGTSVVSCVSGESVTTVIQGFTITGGTGTVSGDHTNGGGMYNYHSSPTVKECIFIGNSSTYKGGGMFNQYCDSTVERCIFTGNQTGYGGGIRNDGSDPIVIGCAFADNAVWGYGGAISNYGSSPTIVNCCLVGNSAGAGGGISTQGQVPDVSHCTLAGNSANRGGAMLNLHDGNPAVSNCIFWNNTATTDDEIRNRDGTTPSFSHCDINGCGGSGMDWDSTFGIDAGGNIDADPLFIDPDGNDHRLSTGSPCIDAGDNAAVPGGISTDLDGEPRFVDDACTMDTGSGTPPIVDIGAYEYQDGPSSDPDHLPCISQISPVPGLMIVDNVGLVRLTVTVTEPVNVSTDAITVESAAEGEVTDFTIQYECPNLIHVDFDPAIRQDRVTITVPDSVRDLDGDSLDGEMSFDAEGVAVFPSGDGIAGGDAVFRIDVLQGDVNRDGVVNVLDAYQLKAALPSIVGDPKYDPLADLNSDGAVNVLDVIIFRNGLGGSLPSDAEHITDPAFFDGLAHITIDFESFPGETEIIPGQTEVTDEWGAWGVRFSREEEPGVWQTTDPEDASGRFDGACCIWAEIPSGGEPTSGVRYLCSECWGYDAYNIGDYRIDFEPPICAFGMYVIDNDFSDIRITAYDADGTELESIFIAEVGEGGVGYHGIVHEGIRYIIIDGDNGSPMDSTYLDDLSFTSGRAPRDADAVGHGDNTLGRVQRPRRRTDR